MKITTDFIRPDKISNILSGHLHLWLIKTSELLQNYGEYIELLSDNEKRKAEGFVFDKDKTSSALTRASLRLLLAHYINKDAKKITFSYADNGKPYVDGADIRFNASHSGEYSLIAFSNKCEVGADIEMIRPIDEINEMAKEMLTPSEMIVFSTYPPTKKSEIFFTFWAHKEAMLKATGTGLTKELKSAEYRRKPNGTLAPKNASYHAYEICSVSEYAAAVVLEEKIETVSTFLYKADI